MPKPQRFCIFCGGPGLTGEHIWADWLRNYIPRQMESYTKSSTSFHPTYTKRKVKKEPGDPHSRKVKIVCTTCNSGWMSKIQEQVKPILIPLINGEPTTLDRTAQSAVSAWVCMAMMAANLVEPDKSVILATEHQWPYSKRTVPLNWAIWIGDFHRQNWKGHMVHNVMALSNAEHVPKVDEMGVARQNTQSSTFVVGRLYIHVVSSLIASVPRNIRLNSPGATKLRRIWYPALSPIQWPPTALDDTEADAIANEFFDRVKAQMDQNGR
jgi:hypothetical protein